MDTGNPQGLAIHPETGDVWSIEHGPQGGDGLSRIFLGRNYGSGLAIREGTLRDGIEPPTHFWVPSIATSGLMIYTLNFFPAWRGSLFIGGLADQKVARLTMDEHRVVREETLLESMGRMRDIRQSLEGYVYVAIESCVGEPTSVPRLEPAGAR
jgi:glucose/arabinose dehydrogenase